MIRDCDVVSITVFIHVNDSDRFKVMNNANSQFGAVVMLVGVSPPWCVCLTEDGG